jgi:hypothetical protein
LQQFLAKRGFSGVVPAEHWQAETNAYLVFHVVLQRQELQRRRLAEKTSVVLSKALILRSYNILSIRSFQPTHSEMTLCGLLEMLNKQVIH